MMYLYFAYTLLWLGTSVHGAVELNLERLYTNLTTGHYKDLLPTVDHKTPVQVSMYLYMGTILGFVEKDARFTVTGTLLFSWNDHRMTWNSTDYGDEQSITIPVTKVWVPPIVLFNAYSDYGDLARSYMKVSCLYNGDCIWFPTLQFDVICSADVTYYPFDSHNCYLFFSINGFSSEKINMTLASNKMDMTFASESPLWELDQENSRMFIQPLPNNGAFTVVGISFKRRPAFYITNLIAPTCLIGVLNNMVFVLPAESGERVGFSVTILLAMAVFQTIVSDSLPTAALPNIPRLCYFLLTDLIIGSLITVCTMIVLRTYSKKESEKVPGCLQTIVSCVSCKRRKTLAVLEDKIVPAEITWHEVGKFLDTILFYFFLIVNIIKNIFLLMILTTERPYTMTNAYSKFT